MQIQQDWKEVKWSGKTNHQKQVENKEGVEKALTTGPKKKGQQTLTVKDYERLENGEAKQIETVSYDFKMALQKARMAKGLKQNELAQLINEKPSVIQSYENGSAIPNGQIINKLNARLGVRLPKAK